MLRDNQINHVTHATDHTQEYLCHNGRAVPTRLDAGSASSSRWRS